MDLSFRQLEVFVHVVECGTFRGAAERLDISQVSVSSHVSALEALLQRQLFERKRGSTAGLTAAGEAAYRRAKDLIRGRDELVGLHTGRSSAHAARSKLRIAAHGYIAERFSKRLASFASTHPEIEIELERRAFEGVLRGLRSCDIEVGFFLSRGPVPEVDSVRMWQEDIALYVGRDHPLAQGEAVAPAQLARFPFYYLPERSHLRNQMDSVLSDIDLQSCPTALVSDDHVLITESLGDSRSFACLFTHGMDALVDQGAVIKLPLSFTLPAFDVRCAVRGPYQRERTMRQLVESLAPH